LLYIEKLARLSECQVELLEIQVFHDVTLWQQVQMYHWFRWSQCL